MYAVRSFGPLLVCAAMFLETASAAPAPLVASGAFSGRGVAALSTPLNYEAFVGAVRLSSGAVVAAGNFGTGQGSDLVIARFNADGRLDPSFGLGGAAFADAGAPDDSIRTMKVLADGRIAVAGRSGGRAMVAMFRGDGSLDPTFAVGGILRTSLIGAAIAGLSDLVVLPDGRLLASGTALMSDGEHVLLVRITPTGALDRSFDDDGVRIVREALGADPRSRPLPDGRIVVAARAPGALQVMRLDPDGRLDLAFGGTGIVSWPTSQATPIAALELVGDGYLVAERADGRLSLVGPDGALRATQSVLPGAQLTALVRHADGRVVASSDAVVSTGRRSTMDVLRLQTTMPATTRAPSAAEIKLARQRCAALRVGAARNACLASAARPVSVPGAPITPTWTLQKGLVLAGGDINVLAIELADNGQLIAAGYAVVGNQTDYLLSVAQLAAQ